jgi:hypothetical protein
MDARVLSRCSSKKGHLGVRINAGKVAAGVQVTIKRIKPKKNRIVSLHKTFSWWCTSYKDCGIGWSWTANGKLPLDAGKSIWVILGKAKTPRQAADSALCYNSPSHWTGIVVSLNFGINPRSTNQPAWKRSRNLRKHANLAVEPENSRISRVFHSGR